MLSLDFLDDVRRMNKRQVRTRAVVYCVVTAASLYGQTSELTSISRRLLFNAVACHLLAT